MKNIFVLFIVLFFSITLHTANAATETVVIQPGPDNGKDTSYGTFYYKDGRPDSEFMHIGGWGDEYFSYLEFDLSDIPSGTEIIDADLFLFQDLEQGGNYNEAKLLLVSEEWTESSITKNNNPNSSDPGLGWIPAPSEIGWWDVDITDIVSSWRNGGHPNYGLKIDGRYTNNNHVRRFLTSDYLDDPSLRPKLVVTYELPEPTPEELVEDIEGVVGEEVEKKAVQNAYFAHIKKFLEFFNGEQVQAALNQIGAFLKKVTKDAQQGDVSPETAEELQELGNDLQEKIETSSSESNVPLITQIASPFPPESAEWADDVYAGGIDSRCDTIAECGCALASMSMLAHSYDVATDVAGGEVNPGNMNAWLTEHDGFLPNGSVWWSRILAYLGEETSDGTYISNFSLASHNETDTTAIDSFLDKGQPVVAFNDVAVNGGHYFVLTEKNDDGSYNVRDPYWYLTKTTNDESALNVNDYNNTITKANLFAYHKKKQLVSDIVELYLASPAELLVTDSQGRKAGFDPESGLIVTEIPGSSYDQADSVNTVVGVEGSHPGKRLIINGAEDAVYTVQVIGTGTGEYTLSSQTVGDTGNFETTHIVAETYSGKVDEYIVDVEVGDGELQDIIAALYGASESLSDEDKAKVVKMLAVIEDKVEKDNLTAAESKTANLLTYIAKKDISDTEELAVLLQELLSSLE